MEEIRKNPNNDLINYKSYGNVVTEDVTYLENRTCALSPVQAPLRLEKEVNGCSVSLIFAENSVPNVRSDIAKMLVDSVTTRRKL